VERAKRSSALQLTVRGVRRGQDQTLQNVEIPAGWNCSCLGMWYTSRKSGVNCKFTA
jgi:hypothetical protein